MLLRFELLLIARRLRSTTKYKINNFLSTKTQQLQINILIYREHLEKTFLLYSIYIIEVCYQLLL